MMGGARQNQPGGTDGEARKVQVVPLTDIFFGDPVDVAVEHFMQPHAHGYDVFKVHSTSPNSFDMVPGDGPIALMIRVSC